jgi:hypothetical protein
MRHAVVAHDELAVVVGVWVVGANATGSVLAIVSLRLRKSEESKRTYRLLSGRLILVRADFRTDR